MKKLLAISYKEATGQSDAWLWPEVLDGTDDTMQLRVATPDTKAASSSDLELGSTKSGHWGHAGVKGQKGGSAPKGGGKAPAEKAYRSSYGHIIEAVEAEYKGKLDELHQRGRENTRLH